MDQRFRKDLGADAAQPSGAPTAGGATTAHSTFGGASLLASFLRWVARVGRDLEATAYRRLRDMERDRGESGPGSPRRTREAELN